MSFECDWREREAAVAQMTELAHENQARVLAGTGSPKILVGGMSLSDFPNFHMSPLIRMGASVVSIALDPAHQLRPDRLFVAHNETLPFAMGRLPKRWKPDFFWDAQAEQGHYFSVGLGELDIPTIVSFNHAHLGQALLHMQGLFDCVIAPSKFMSAWGDATLPWGASWGTMDERIRIFGRSYKGEEKDVDVSCTIGTSGSGRESIRWKILQGIQEIKARRPDLKIVIDNTLKQGDYFSLLARSKASICVGSWGTPMTYRPLEIIAQQAILIHVDEDAYGSEAKMKEFFEAGDHGWFIPADVGSLEVAIGRALAFREPKYRSDDIRLAVGVSYSYEEQYKKLFELAGSVKKKPKINLVDWSRRAFAVNLLTGYKDLAGVHAWAMTDADKASLHTYPGDGWDVCLWSPKDPEQRWRWMTDLAREKGNHYEVYRRYALPT